MCLEALGSKCQGGECKTGTKGSSCKVLGPGRCSTCYVGYYPEPEEPEFDYSIQDLIQVDMLPTAELLPVEDSDPLEANVEYVGSRWYSDGLRGGDRVLLINGQPVTDAILETLFEVVDDLFLYVRRPSTNQEMTITVHGPPTVHD